MEAMSCVPMYSKGSELPKLDVHSKSQGEWEESLNMVACCKGIMNRPNNLGNFLVDDQLGEHGVVFVVQITGPNSGALWAAAVHQKGLDVIDDDLHPILAHEYPQDKNPNIGIIASYLLNGSLNGTAGPRSWVDLADMESFAEILTQKSGEADGIDMRKMNGSGTLGVTFQALHSHIPEWYFDDESNWSPRPYEVQGMKLLIVLATDPSDFVSFEHPVRHLTNDVIVPRVIVFCVFCLVILACCYCFLTRATRQAEELQLLMQRVSEMDFERWSFRLSHVSEFRALQSSFDKIRQNLQKLQRLM